MFLNRVINIQRCVINYANIKLFKSLQWQMENESKNVHTEVVSCCINYIKKNMKEAKTQKYLKAEDREDRYKLISQSS